MRHCFTLICCCLALSLFAQEATTGLALKYAPTQLREKSFFTDRGRGP